MRTAGHPSAIFAHRAGRDTADDDPVRALHRRLDFYPTPPWAARAIGHFLRELDPEARTVWEPACGEGHFAHGLSDAFDTVFASDVHAHGYGQVLDFMDPEADGQGAFDWVATNPPFESAAAFARLGWRRARRGVALLCRSGFEESIGRYSLFHGPAPITMKVVFTERVAMHLGAYKPGKASAALYSLFIWCKPPLAAQYPAAPLWRAFPPGTRARFERAVDARWARAA